MKKRLTIVTILVIFILTLCGCCEHDWEDATCTEAMTCTLCGETEGEALGHDEGDWSDWGIDEDNLVYERTKWCKRCEKISSRESGEAVTSFIENKTLQIAPCDFADRFEDSSMNGYDFECDVVHNDNKMFYDESNYLFYELCNDDQKIGMCSFVKDGGGTLPYSEQYSSGSAKGINILVEESKDVSAVVFATVQALELKLDYSGQADLAQKIVDNVNNMEGVTENDINYVLYMEGGSRYHYLVVSFV